MIRTSICYLCFSAHLLNFIKEQHKKLSFSILFSLLELGGRHGPYQLVVQIQFQYKYQYSIKSKSTKYLSYKNQSSQQNW